jgi:hypothetical protein
MAHGLADIWLTEPDRGQEAGARRRRRPRVSQNAGSTTPGLSGVPVGWLVSGLGRRRAALHLTCLRSCARLPLPRRQASGDSRSCRSRPRRSRFRRSADMVRSVCAPSRCMSGSAAELRCVRCSCSDLERRAHAVRCGPDRASPGPEGQRVRLRVWRMVAGYQRWPPWAVGTRSVLSPVAIAARVLPAARSRRIRSMT